MDRDEKRETFFCDIVAGHQYAAALTFTAKDGNQWHPTKSVIYINGQQAEPIEVDDSNIFAAYSIILNSGKTGPLYNYQSAQTIMAAYIFPKLTEGISTGIHNGQKDSVKGQRDEWFTIDGQMLSGRPSKKGVYIYNGKKAVIN